MFSDVFTQFYDSSALWDLLKVEVTLSVFCLRLLISSYRCGVFGLEITRPSNCVSRIFFFPFLNSLLRFLEVACGALLLVAVIAHVNYRVRLLDKQTLKIKRITSCAAETYHSV